MSGQLAKLFMRGSLVNVTAKNLTEEQSQQVATLMNTLWEDQILDSAKHKFCNILGCTIGNEYKDKDFAMNEIWITLWRTAVDVLYHHPKPSVIENIHARRKYFKNCIYMYMKQILNENKIPAYRYERTISGEATSVTKEIIQFYLDNILTKPIDYSIEETDNSTRILVDVNEIPNEIMGKIWKLRDEVKDFGVLIVITNSITIVPNGEVKNLTKKVSEKARVKSCSLSGLDQDEDCDNFQQHCDYKNNRQRETELDTMLIQDSIETLSNRLPETAKKVFQILVDTPEDFLEEYYPKRKKDIRPREAQIAKYLGLSKSEVSEAMKIIQKQATALDIA